MHSVQQHWEKVYENKATPWDVGLPDENLVAFIGSWAVKPCRALELGCGYGNDAIFLAKNGFKVTAIDVSRLAIDEAKKRALKQKAKVNFLVEDASELKSISGKFDLVVDRCTFHFISEDKRESYVANLKRLLNKDGYFVLIVSSDKDTVVGPYQFSEDDIRRIFSSDFDILELRLVTLKQHKLSPRPYFCLMRRK